MSNLFHKKLSVLVLAAGKGTRMKSSRPKALHTLSEKWMIRYVLETVDRLSPRRVYLLLGHRADEIRRALNRKDLVYLDQKVQKGTGHALLTALQAIPKKDMRDYLCVLNGDAPLLQTKTLSRLVRTHIRRKAVLTLLTCDLENPRGYGRLVRDKNRHPVRIVEEKNASPEERRQKEVNAGVYCLSLPDILPLLKQIKADRKTREFYVTDLLGISVRQGVRVATVRSNSPEEITGINSNQDLAAVQKILWERKTEKCMASGVTILAPETTFIDTDVRIGCDTVISPCVTIMGRTVIGKGCHIGRFSTIKNCKIGDNIRISGHITIRDMVIKSDGSFIT